MACDSRQYRFHHAAFVAVRALADLHEPVLELVGIAELVHTGMNPIS